MKLENLEVWKLTRQVVREVMILSPRLQRIGLADQVRRAVVSIGSNIAEGAGRASDREVIRFLVIARGSTAEVQAQLTLAVDCGITIDPAVLDRVDHVRRMLSALIKRLEGSG
jgi:four helix bundle protein